MRQKKKLKFANKEYDSTFQLISWWEVEKVRNAQIMVVGAGALGNEVLKNLALLNVGKIVIVDFDTIEYSNLSRSVLFREEDCLSENFKADVAAKRIKEINPKVKVKVIKGDIGIDVGLGIFARMDAIIGALDNRLARLYLNRACFRVNKPWIDGALQNLSGQMAVFRPGESCYECSLSEQDWENIKRRIGCWDIAQRNISYGRIPTTPISSSIIAAIQVQEALKILHEDHDKLFSKKTFYYEGRNFDLLTFQADPLKEDCLSHYDYGPITKGEFLSADLSIGETIALLKKKLKLKNPIIKLDHQLVTEITLSESEKVIPLTIPLPHLSEKRWVEFKGDPGDEVVVSQDMNSIDESFTRKDLTLLEVGIPHLHIIRVFDEDEIHFVELTGDEEKLQYT